MLYWSRFPYIRFLIFFITGIVLYRNLSLKIPYLIPLFFALFMVYLFLIRVSVKKRFIRFNFLIGLCAMVLFTLSGYLITWENDDRRFPDHLLNKSAEIEACLGKIMEINQEDRSGIRLVSDCRLVKIKGSWEPADGRIFIIIKKSGPAAPGPLGPGDWIVFAGSPLKIDPPRNPGQFNYSAYMAERNIFYRLYLKPGRVKIVQRAAGFNPIRMAEKLNSAFRNILAVHIREREALGLVAALTLGSKDQLDDTVEQDYAKAGISHILAVSGLHVGILYMVILILIKPLYKNAKFGWTGSLIVLGILIAFAFITGLTPSVMRSVVMFSFIEIGRRMGRKTVSFNTLAASAFYLLCYNPHFLYAAGFQLSYLAVLGIIFFQPYFYRLLTFKAAFIDYFWQLVTVSIAAQLMTFPVTSYYFHTFPVYFILANILAIPCSFAILVSGLSVLAFHILSPLANLSGIMVTWVIRYFNLFIHTLGSLPLSQVKNIHMEAWMTFLLFFTILMVMRLMLEKKTVYLYLAFAGLFIFFSARDRYAWSTFHREKIIFYYSESGPVIEIIRGNRGYLLADSVLCNQPGYLSRVTGSLCAIENHPYILSGPARPEIAYRLSSGYRLYSWKGKTLLVITDAKAFKKVSLEKPIFSDYILLCTRSGYALESIWRNFGANYWIIDGSCSFYSSAFIKKEFQKKGIPYLSVKDNGAITLDL